MGGRADGHVVEVTQLHCIVQCMVLCVPRALSLRSHGGPGPSEARGSLAPALTQGRLHSQATPRRLPQNYRRAAPLRAARLLLAHGLPRVRAGRGARFAASTERPPALRRGRRVDASHCPAGEEPADPEQGPRRAQTPPSDPSRQTPPQGPPNGL